MNINIKIMRMMAMMTMKMKKLLLYSGMKNGKITSFEELTVFKYEFNTPDRFQRELHAFQLVSVSVDEKLILMI